MSSPFSPAIAEFLSAPRCAAIATFGPDNMLHQAVVWFSLAEDGVLINSLEGRRWPANLRRDPRMSLAIFDGEDYVIIRGEAEVVGDAERGQRDIRSLARRYGVDPEFFAGQHRVSFIVRPDHVALHGSLAES